MNFEHKPVLLNEVIAGLEIKPGGVYVDCTVGGGGHSFEIAKRMANGHLYAFDRDQEAIVASKERLKEFDNVTFIHDNYKNAKEDLDNLGVAGVDGVLIDLGVSSPQLDHGERGFSFLHEGRLDMRMDRRQKLSAYEVVNTYPREKLVEILYKYGEESNAKNIVQKIMEAREKSPIETTTELKNIVESAFPKKVIYGKGGVSKQTFQAIRIEVNGELEGLEQALSDLAGKLSSGGRMAVISFHSLEDRIVKNLFKNLSTDCICPPKTPVCICGHKASVKLINKKPITASKEELEFNPRSSSAKLRIIEKL